MFVAVIIPVYNESQFITQVLRGIGPEVSHIIVVDDCSTDNTVEVVRHNKVHGEEHRLQTVFRTVYYEFADGRVQLKNYSSQNSTISLLA